MKRILAHRVTIGFIVLGVAVFAALAIEVHDQQQRNERVARIQLASCHRSQSYWDKFHGIVDVLESLSVTQQQVDEITNPALKAYGQSRVDAFKDNQHQLDLKPLGERPRCRDD